MGWFCGRGRSEVCLAHHIGPLKEERRNIPTRLSETGLARPPIEPVPKRNRPAGKRRFLLVALLAVIITSAVCHPLVRWLHIRTGTVSHRLIGDSFGQPRFWLAGSSITGDGIAWDTVSSERRRGLETWFVAGSSPCEWEPFQRLDPAAPISFIGVSVYDLNEEYLCDFRSQIVSWPQALRDLTKTHCRWDYSKRVLSQYPLKYIRLLFPTAGRSQGVMGGLKEQARNYFHLGSAADSEAGPGIPTFDARSVNPIKRQKISTWPKARLLQRLTKMKSACFGLHSFDGPKKLALRRILEEATARGRVAVVVVLPVSPAYQKEFLTPEVNSAFENSIASLQRDVPRAKWIRLDRLPELNSDDNFWDVVHMNVEGQQIATDALLHQLNTINPY